jgi:hypothetical protein
MSPFTVQMGIALDEWERARDAWSCAAARLAHASVHGGGDAGADLDSLAALVSVSAIYVQWTWSVLMQFAGM